MKIKAEVSERIQTTHSSALLDLFSYTNIPVGLCTTSAAAAAFHINEREINLSCLIFIFFSTIFIYNLERLKPSPADKSNSPERSSWIRDNKNTLTNINLVLIIACLYLLFSSYSAALLTTAATLLGLSLCYSGKLKNIPAMKNIMVASIWTVTVSIFPIIWISESIPKFNTNYAFICFGCAFINTIMFDMRDVTGDKESGIKSIPVILKPKPCYLICLITGIAVTILSINTSMAILCMIPLFYAILLIKEESRLKYLLADLILALPLLLIL